MAWNRGIPCKTLKITHNYLIFLFYHNYLINFFIISRSTELVFESFKFFRSKWWDSLGESVSLWVRYDLKQGNRLQIIKIIHNYLIYVFYHHFLINSLSISRSTELIFYCSMIIFAMQGYVLWVKVLDIEAGTAWSRRIPLKIWKYLTTP